MDTFIHCIESESGTMFNTFSEAYGNQSLALCREVFLGAEAGQNPKNDERLMVASYMGGLSLTYSEVGVCHALSYGLSYVLGTRHCIGNCIVFPHLPEYYAKGVEEFNRMVDHHKIDIPQGLSKEWSDDQVEKMIDICLALRHMWNHAIGGGVGKNHHP